MYNPTTNGSFLLSEGIELINSHHNTLYGNDIVDNIGPLGASTVGFDVNFCIGNRFCCNSTFGNETGVNFWGSCTNTRFRLTSMDKHLFSLRLRGDSTSGYTIIGMQPVQTKPLTN